MVVGAGGAAQGWLRGGGRSTVDVSGQALCSVALLRAAVLPAASCHPGKLGPNRGGHTEGPPSPAPSLQQRSRGVAGDRQGQRSLL